MARPCEDIKERFMAKISPEPMSGCWLWDAQTNHSGYGLIWTRGRQGKAVRAHRVSYELFKGPIDDGLFVCHKCDTPQCVNPDHLFLGRDIDNIHDMVSKGRHWMASRTMCKNGLHPVTEENTYRFKSGKTCRLCYEEKTKDYYAKNKERILERVREYGRRTRVPKPRVRPTHCPQGHEYREGSFYLVKGKYRTCKACISQRMKTKRKESSL